MVAPHRSRAAVSCSNVEKAFRQGSARVLALRGIDLEVASGQMTLIVGPSGCGKTTLISVIAGILDPTRGDVRVFGENIVDLPSAGRSKFRSRHIGIVFQQFNLLPAFSAAENVAIPLIIQHCSRRRALLKASELLEQVGMSDFLTIRPSQLSSGQQQRVAIARALITQPRLVVCDEPTSALDSESGHSVMRLLQSLAVRRDRAVLVVTHDARLYQFADRIAYMEDGRIQRTESRDEDGSRDRSTVVVMSHVTGEWR